MDGLGVKWTVFWRKADRVLKMSLMMICQIVFGDFEPFGMIPQRARINYSVIQSDISFPRHSKKISIFENFDKFYFSLSRERPITQIRSRVQNFIIWYIFARAGKSVIHVTAYNLSNFTKFRKKSRKFLNQLFSMDINYVL